MPNPIIDNQALSDIEVGQSVQQVQIPDQDTYDAILNNMINAFYGHRSECDTLGSAEKKCREVLDTCISGFKSDGRLWVKAPGKGSNDWQEILKKRLNVFKYNYTTKKLIPSGRGVGAGSKPNESPDNNLEQNNLLSDKRIIKNALTEEEESDFDKFKNRFVEDFPTSVTAVDEIMISRLAFLMVLSNRDLRDVELSKGLTKEMQELSESLGVSGKQRNSYSSNEMKGTLEELSTRYRKTLDTHKEIDTAWRIEELTLISNAIHRGSTPTFLAISWVKSMCF